MAVPIATAVFVAAARYGAQALGIGVVTFVGIEAVLNTTQTYIINNLSGISGDAAQLVGLMGIDTAISMILSAYSVRMAMWVASRFIFSGS